MPQRVSSLAFAAAAMCCILASGAGLADRAHAGACGDLDGNGQVAATDALIVLRQSVGIGDDLDCRVPEAGVVADLEARVAALEELLGSAELVGDTLVLTGVNLQIVDGSGSTAGGEPQCRRDKDCADGESCTDFGRCVQGEGVGNLIIGYNESDEDLKIGSHNVVVGALHTYTGYGAIVAGRDNEVGGAAASVTGGHANSAVGDFSSVSAGTDNVAEGLSSLIAGGSSNHAFSDESSILGGTFNRTTGVTAAVCGGRRNRAQGFAASVLGGTDNEARGRASSIAGGELNFTTALHAVVVGGRGNVGGGNSSVVLGTTGFTSNSELELIPVNTSFR